MEIPHFYQYFWGVFGLRNRIVDPEGTMESTFFVSLPPCQILPQMLTLHLNISQAVLARKYQARARCG